MTLTSIRTYILNVLIGLDQFANTLIGGLPDETISSRVYRNSLNYWYAKPVRVLIDAIFRLVDGPEHCKQAYESELKHSHTFDHQHQAAKGA